MNISHNFIFSKTCNLTEKNGKTFFVHPCMVLKNREINDLYKMAQNHSAFSSISLRSFKQMVMFYVKENECKWSTQCYCEKCGNSRAAVRYINQLGKSDCYRDQVMIDLNEEKWFEEFLCDNTARSGSTRDQLICLRRKKANKKCFLHKKKNKNCDGKN